MKKIITAFYLSAFILIAFPNMQVQAQSFGMEEDSLGAGGQLPIDEDEYVDTIPQTAEEIQAQMEEEAEAQRIKLRGEAFNVALDNLLPLTPEEIEETLQEFRISREKAESPLTKIIPKVHIQTVALDPGVLPPTIKLTPGHVTTLSILDSTGAPWPIRDVSWGGVFEVQTPEQGAHVIRITPMTAHGVGNMSIRLINLTTPITFSLATGLDEAHFRFDARIPKMGPLAKTPLIKSAVGGLKIAAGDSVVVGILDGVPPEGAVRRKVSGVDGRTSVWEFGNEMYLRTPLSLLSPSWSGSATSADGMNVYSMAETPVVLLSDNGQMVRAYIENDGDIQ